ncbi:MAG TPA: SDR family NAD(P)-dependent oxidoreductase [Candidatus Acidoferrum sp.]|nr:SDR family NAD(P)-dependent oxidoreductase [Candidatus Acidoferrum sp.]
MRERILITGGAGFIGSHLAHRLVDEGYFPVLLDNLARGKTEYINDLVSNGTAKFVQGDVRDEQTVRDCMKNAEYVFHEASLCINYCFAHPEECLSVNIDGSYNVFKIAKELGVKRVIFASSASVYGNATHFPTNEDDKLSPLTPYCVSKISDEFLLKISGVEHNILRYFNVYGARQSTDAYYTSVIVNFIKKMMVNESPTIHGDGEQTMDFVNVRDIVEANYLAMTTKRANEIFNVASGESTSVNDLFRLLAQIVGSKVKPVYKPFPASGKLVTRRQADISRIKSIGWKTQVTLKQGLSELVEDVKKNPSLYG